MFYFCILSNKLDLFETTHFIIHSNPHTHAHTFYACRCTNQGILTLYHWPPVWLTWNQLYDNWQFLFLFAKQTNPNQSKQEVNGTVILPPLLFPAQTHIHTHTPYFNSHTHTLCHSHSCSHTTHILSVSVHSLSLSQIHTHTLPLSHIHTHRLCLNTYTQYL